VSAEREREWVPRRSEAHMNLLLSRSLAAARIAAVTGAFALPIAPHTARSDETCLSPYTATLVKGQEAFLHIWTLGEKGLGDESDKLVTIDADPKSQSYGKVLGSISVGGRGEAHHMGFTDDRKYLWAGRLDDSQIFVFDDRRSPRQDRLRRPPHVLCFARTDADRRLVERQDPRRRHRPRRLQQQG
jgi:hypothetical protein